MERLKRASVALKSYREPWLDTSSPAIAELLMAVFAWIAAQERERIVERVHAGLKRARSHGTKSGKAIGRPVLGLDGAGARLALKRGGSLRKAAALLGVSTRTLARRLAG